MQDFDYVFYKNINFIRFLPLRNRKSVVIPGEFNVVTKVPVVGLSKNETKSDRKKRTLEGMVNTEEKLYNIKRIFLTSAVWCQRTKEKKSVDNKNRGVGLFSQ